MLSKAEKDSFNLNLTEDFFQIIKYQEGQNLTGQFLL